MHKTLNIFFSLFFYLDLLILWLYAFMSDILIIFDILNGGWNANWKLNKFSTQNAHARRLQYSDVKTFEFRCLCFDLFRLLFKQCENNNFGMQLSAMSSLRLNIPNCILLMLHILHTLISLTVDIHISFGDIFPT